MYRSEKANALYGWGPGEAFAYRRLAYHKMARILAQRRTPRLQRAVQVGFVCLSVCLYVCLPVYLSICLYVCLSICLVRVRCLFILRIL